MKRITTFTLWIALLVPFLTSCDVLLPRRDGQPYFDTGRNRTPEQIQRREAVQQQQAAEANRKANAAIASRQAVDRRNAERDRQYQTRSWCEWHNERRRREALAKGSQSYQREDCSRYPR